MTDSVTGRVASEGRARFVRPHARDTLVGVTFSGAREKRVEEALRAGRGDLRPLACGAQGHRDGHTLACPHVYWFSCLVLFRHM